MYERKKLLTTFRSIAQKKKKRKTWNHYLAVIHKHLKFQYTLKSTINNNKYQIKINIYAKTLIIHSTASRYSKNVTTFKTKTNNADNKRHTGFTGTGRQIFILSSTTFHFNFFKLFTGVTLIFICSIHHFSIPFCFFIVYFLCFLTHHTHTRRWTDTNVKNLSHSALTNKRNFFTLQWIMIIASLRCRYYILQMIEKIIYALLQSKRTKAHTHTQIGKRYKEREMKTKEKKIKEIWSKTKYLYRVNACEFLIFFFYLCHFVRKCQSICSYEKKN